MNRWMCGLLMVCLLWGGVLRCALAAEEERGLTLTNLTVTDQKEQPVLLYQESHALVIGVSQYREWPDLPGVLQDVQAVQAALETQGFQVAVNLNPTKNDLMLAIDEFITQYGHVPDNRLLIYFAGHGHTLQLAYGGEMGYIIPADAPLPSADGPGFFAKAIDMQMIEVYARRIEAKHALFLFDSCFSGSIFAVGRAAPDDITYKTANPVRQFITSGSANEMVPDESVFRQQLVAALNGDADKNGDGYVTGSELGMFLEDTVINYSRGAQHPQYGKIRDPYLDKGDFVFVLPGGVYVEQQIVPPQTTPALPGDPEHEMWELVKTSDDPSDVQDFLTAFPDGRFAQAAKLKLKQLERQRQATPSPTPAEEAADLRPGDVLLRDNFSAGTSTARALFGQDIMTFENRRGQGCLTARQANVVLPAMYATPQAADFIAEFDMYPAQVSPESRYGLIFRSDDAPGGLDHYYVFNLHPAKDAVEVWAWNRGWGFSADAFAPQGELTEAASYHVRLEVHQQRMRIAINGVLVGEFKDSGLSAPGIFGLSIIPAAAPETVCFDNLTVSAIR